MLKMASHDPPHRHYNNGVQEDFPSRLQNGDSADLIRANPFYAHYKESTSSTDGTEASIQPDNFISVPTMKFISSPQELGYEIKTTENKDLNVPQRYDPKDELFSPSSLRLNTTANGDFHDLVQTQKFSKRRQRNGSDVVTDDVDALFGSPNKAEAPNPFCKTSASEADLFSRNSEELFHPDNTPSTDNDNSFKKGFDVFSPPTNPVDPFPRPLPRNLFNVPSLDDPFGPTPSKTMSSTPLTNRPSEMKLDTPVSTGLAKKTPPKVPPVVPRKPATKPKDFLTTPQGSKEEFLEPTSFSQASSLSSSPSFSPADVTHVQTFKRPPRPLPRTRRPKAEKPPKPERPPPPVYSTKVEPEVPEPHTAEPEPPKPPPKPVLKPVLKPLPKPVLPHKPKKMESKPLEPENFVVFEDVLLIGQERCVEDWPEDSPELDPDFKPSGTFKLRRESLKVKMESDGGSSEDPDGTFGHVKKRDRKLRMSLLSRRSSKDKYSDDAMGEKSNTLPSRRKSPKDFGSSDHISTGDDEDPYSLDYKKKSTKTKVNRLFRRASIGSSAYDDELSLQHSKDGDQKKSSKRRNTTVRRQSADSVLDGEDYEDGEKGGHRQRRNSKVKVKFVPQRGFAISLEKSHNEPKGAHGYTSRKGSKDKSVEESGAHGYTPRDKLQDDDFEGLEEVEALSRRSAKAAFTDDEQQTSHRYSPSLQGDDDVELSKERKHKKSKHKIHLPHKSKASHGLNEGSTDDEMTEKDMKSHEEEYDEDPDEIEMLKLKKPVKPKVPKKHKHKSKKAKNQSEAPSDEHLSEAAQAAWQAARMDEQVAAGEEEDEEEDGDTDSLLEWWYTVEKWDEVASDEEDAAVKEDESKSFTILAEKVERGLRLFNKVFTEQAEVLWESIISLHALADDINEFHHKAKIAGISGGTTTAVGTVAAITGLALAPVTFGASLVITAVGVGVATAGGITSASAAISDNVNNKNDRKKIEGLLQEYEERMLEISNILHFVNQGLRRLRGHPFLRSGTQHYSQDWEVRRAVQMISIVDSPVMRATEITDDVVGSLRGLFKGMDKYFVNETRELKKGCKKEIVAVIRQVANVLNDCIVELNAIRENLQDATGQM
ncbi:protein piccolo-like isoform X2 [Xiphophorus maculatus]|uniref:protein piccolo-like isoform X2 n=1 Tax=Xiphophorus maculatus TaxID=8083 RepID=UPI000C6D2077|nr:protein piccolo-like isoform X2 [Xiphophorus maculatus]